MSVTLHISDDEAALLQRALRIYLQDVLGSGSDGSNSHVALSAVMEREVLASVRARLHRRDAVPPSQQHEVLAGTCARVATHVTAVLVAADALRDRRTEDSNALDGHLLDALLAEARAALRRLHQIGVTIPPVDREPWSGRRRRSPNPTMVPERW